MSCINYLQKLQEQKEYLNLAAKDIKTLENVVEDLCDEVEKLYKEIAHTNYELAKHIKYCHHPNATNNTQEVFQNEKE
jgi:hypothetical protein